MFSTVDSLRSLSASPIVRHPLRWILFFAWLLATTAAMPAIAIASLIPKSDLATEKLSSARTSPVKHTAIPETPAENETQNQTRKVAEIIEREGHDYSFRAALSTTTIDVGAFDIDAWIHDDAFANLIPFTGPLGNKLKTQGQGCHRFNGQEDFQIDYNIQGQWGDLHADDQKTVLWSEYHTRDLLLQALVVILKHASEGSRYSIFSDCQGDDTSYRGAFVGNRRFRCSQSPSIPCPDQPTGCGWIGTRVCPQICSESLPGPCYTEKTGIVLPAEVTVTLYDRNSPVLQTMTLTMHSKKLVVHQKCPFAFKMLLMSLNFMPGIAGNAMKSMVYTSCAVLDLEAENDQADNIVHHGND